MKINQVMIRKLLLFLFVITAKGQILHHQMLSAQGQNSVLQSGVVVHQTIGQQSAVGTFSSSQFQVEQGYQQRKLLSSVTNSSSIIEIVAFPVPFIDTVTFQFSEVITAPVSVVFYDVLGRVVYSKTLTIESQNSFTLQQLSFAEGEYFVKLKYLNNEYSIKLLRSK